VGARVRVRDGHRAPSLVRTVGTITRVYRSSGRTALHVRLDDGRWQLFWPQEVEGPEGEPETGQSGRRPVGRA
jgi:hypothetical protein